MTMAHPALIALNDAWSQLQDEAGKVVAQQKKLEQLKQNEADLTAKVNELAKQAADSKTVVSDAEKQAKKIIADALNEAAKIRGQANSDKNLVLNSATSAAENMLAKARTDAEKLTATAKATLTSALDKAAVAEEKARMATQTYEALKQKAQAFVE